jgi:hypothetical protein
LHITPITETQSPKPKPSRLVTRYTQAAHSIESTYQVGSVRKILFLDFDGVLHSASGNSLPEFFHVPGLAQGLAGRPCEIVISSTWREHYSLARLKQFLSPELAGRVIGVTGPDPPGRYPRHQAILQYLETVGGAVEWRALDDSGSEFYECPNLILCDGAIGLTGSSRTGERLARQGELRDITLS